jgi:glycosyltransferase involved in cell wall biosynthesis
MKITIATGPSFPVPAVIGGAMARVWQGLAEQFVQHGHEVCIFARAFPGQPAEEQIRGVRYLRFGGFAQSRSIVQDLLKDLVYAAGAVWRVPAADIFVINDFWLPVVAGLFPRRCGRIIVNANRHPKGQFCLYWQAARIAAASNAVRAAIIKQCRRLESRIRVLPNPIDTRVLRPSCSSQSISAPPTFLFVGRLHPEKGVHLLVQAFQRAAASHPECCLLLVGPAADNQGGGGEGYLRRLRELAGDSKVEFHAPTYDLAKLAACYRRATVFCYPSLAEKGEAFGVAPLEAMACGVPSIVSRLDCFQDFIIDGVNGWTFNHRSSDPVESLADALVHAIRDKQVLADVALRAHTTAMQFSYEAVANAYLADFATLLNSL